MVSFKVTSSLQNFDQTEHKVKHLDTFDKSEDAVLKLHRNGKQT